MYNYNLTISSSFQKSVLLDVMAQQSPSHAPGGPAAPGTECHSWPLTYILLPGMHQCNTDCKGWCLVIAQWVRILASLIPSQYWLSNFAMYHTIKYTREYNALWGEPERAMEVCCKLSSSVKDSALSKNADILTLSGLGNRREDWSVHELWTITAYSPPRARAKRGEVGKRTR